MKACERVIGHYSRESLASQVASLGQGLGAVLDD